MLNHLAAFAPAHTHRQCPLDVLARRVELTAAKMDDAQQMPRTGMPWIVADHVFIERRRVLRTPRLMQYWK
ncbi:MAG: hypothetical protein NTW96_24765 [Planctomycetia bacterium]|nr:hypothetical protein [Planctomycetia bacterium]